MVPSGGANRRIGEYGEGAMGPGLEKGALRPHNQLYRPLTPPIKNPGSKKGNMGMNQRQ